MARIEKVISTGHKLGKTFRCWSTLNDIYIGSERDSASGESRTPDSWAHLRKYLDRSAVLPIFSIAS